MCWQCMGTNPSLQGENKKSKRITVLLTCLRELRDFSIYNYIGKNTFQQKTIGNFTRRGNNFSYYCDGYF